MKLVQQENEHLMNGHGFVDQDILRRMVVGVNFHEDLLDVRFVHLLQGETNGILARCRRLQGLAREELGEENSVLRQGSLVTHTRRRGHLLMHQW